MQNVTDLYSGSGAFYESMLTACLIKFGEGKNDHATMDHYANKLLRFFVGGMRSHNNAMRLFLRALLAQELGNYYLTGIKTPGLLESVEKMDKFFWLKGNPQSHENKLLM